MRTTLLLLLATPLAAQFWYPRHNFTFGVGSGQPRGDLDRVLSDSAGISIGYGYRFHRYLQADVGLDTILFAARVRDYLPTGFGDLRIRDYQFLVPFGGRVILPVDRGRLLVSAGGGGAHIRYTELLRQVSDYVSIDCRVCNSRYGWGYYGLVSGSLALDRRRQFRLGATARVYQGHTRGDPLGPLPPFRTRDRWVNVFGELGVSF